MSRGTRTSAQSGLWIAASNLPKSPGQPCYARRSAVLEGHDFDRFVEDLGRGGYAPVRGRPRLAPGRYFRRLLGGYCEGLDAARGIAWRATDALAVRSFLRLALDEAAPDHARLSRPRRLIDLETHRAVFTWVQVRLLEAGLLKGKTVAIDAPTLAANAALRSLVRRATGERYQAFLTALAQASGSATPTRAAVARLDRQRPQKSSNADWTPPGEPGAKVAKMKDGRTQLAHTAEPAVDLATGALAAVTLPGAEAGETTTLNETLNVAAEQIAAAQVVVTAPQARAEVSADKGYPSNQTLVERAAGGRRADSAEPHRGRRDWPAASAAQAPGYAKRRRIRGVRGRRLMRRRGELRARSCAHRYDPGGMRRTHLRGHTNILKRLLIQAGGFNLGLLLRTLLGVGTPRGRQDRGGRAVAALLYLIHLVGDPFTVSVLSRCSIPASHHANCGSSAAFFVAPEIATCATGC